MKTHLAWAFILENLRNSWSSQSQSSSVKRKLEDVDDVNEPNTKQQERNVKYDKDSKIQNKFDDAMLEFFAMTFSPFYLANSEYLNPK